MTSFRLVRGASRFGVVLVLALWGLVGVSSEAGAATTAAAASCSSGLPAGANAVGMARTADGDGYWEVDDLGDVVALGDAACFGSLTGTTLHDPIVGMASTPSGGGYWLVAADGGVFAFGDAAFYTQPIVGMAGCGGYYEVVADGGFSHSVPRSSAPRVANISTRPSSA